MVAAETILVVDDEPMLCDILCEVLRSYDYNVLTAENGKMALDVLKDKAVDLLITDVMMPEVDGYQLAAKVSELYPNVKVQLMSGFHNGDNQHLVHPELTRNLLSKPVSASMLLNRVSEIFS